MKYIKQRVSFAEKERNNGQWGKDNVDALEEYAYQDWNWNGKSYSPDSRMEMMIRSYKLYASELDQTDLENVFNPLGYDIGQKKDEIQAYNVSHTKIDALHGELMKRPFNMKAVLTTDERAMASLEVLDKLMKEYLVAETNKQIMINTLKEKNLPEEEFNKAVQEIEAQFAEVKNPEQIMDYISNEYLEPREIKANKILNLLVRKEDILEKKSDSFKHGLLSSEEHAWVGEINGNPVIRVLNPLNSFYHKSPEVKYVQKGDYAGTRVKMSVADVLDIYRNLKPEDVKKLEERYAFVANEKMSDKMKYNFKHLELEFAKAGYLNDRGSYGYSYSDLVDVFHVEWRSQVKVGFATFVDEQGEETVEFLDETISEKDLKGIPGFSKLVWEWLPQVWEGTKIDEDIYVDIRPIPDQTISISNPYEQDLRYHGVVYNNMNSKQISQMERARNLQYLYFIVMHNMKKLIATDKGKIFGLDSSMLDPKIDLEKAIYYMDTLNIYVYNSLANADQPGGSQRSGALNNAVDRSNSQHIANYISILDYLDKQIGQVIGVPPSREGQTMSNEAVTNAQQNLIQSSVVTEMIFNAHTKHWEKVLDSLVNVAIRLYNKNPKLYSYLSESNKHESINVKKSEFDNCDFNVFVVDSPQDNEIFRQLQALAQPLLQNDKARFSHIIKLIKQKSSIEELTRDIEKFEAMSDERAQQEGQSQQQAIQMQMELEAQEAEKQRQFELQKTQMEIEGKIRVAEIQSFARNQDQDIDDNGVPDQLEIDKLRNEREKISIEREKLKQESQEAEKDRKHEKELQEKDIEGKIKIEKAKPKPKPPASKK